MYCGFKFSFYFLQFQDFYSLNVPISFKLCTEYQYYGYIELITAHGYKLTTEHGYIKLITEHGYIKLLTAHGYVELRVLFGVT